jgi:hypothetical protein
VGGTIHTQLYDPATDRWSAGGDVPPDQQIQTVTPVGDGKVLVGGVTKAMVYDTASQVWMDAGDYPGYWTDYSVARLPSGDILFVGGVAQATTADQRMLQVDALQLMRWNHVTGNLGAAQSAPLAFANASTAVLPDGTVLVVGGNPAISGDPLPTAHIYNPASRLWSAAASLPAARVQAATATLRDGSVLIAGGFGMFAGTPPPSLVYVPQLKASPIAATITKPNAPAALPIATAASVLIALVALLLAWQLVARARRRNRAR